MSVAVWRSRRLSTLVPWCLGSCAVALRSSTLGWGFRVPVGMSCHLFFLTTFDPHCLLRGYKQGFAQKQVVLHSELFINKLQEDVSTYRTPPPFTLPTRTTEPRFQPHDWLHKSGDLMSVVRFPSSRQKGRPSQPRKTCKRDRRGNRLPASRRTRFRPPGASSTRHRCAGSCLSTSKIIAEKEGPHTTCATHVGLARSCTRGHGLVHIMANRLSARPLAVTA